MIAGSKPSSGPMEPSPREGIRLTERERDDLTKFQTETKMSGKTLHEALTALVNSDSYKALPDTGGALGPKAQQIKIVYDAYALNAEAKLREKYKQANSLATLLERHRILIGAGR